MVLQGQSWDGLTRNTSPHCEIEFVRPPTRTTRLPQDQSPTPLCRPRRRWQRRSNSTLPQRGILGLLLTTTQSRLARAWLTASSRNSTKRSTTSAAIRCPAQRGGLMSWGFPNSGVGRSSVSRMSCSTSTDHLSSTCGGSFTPDATFPPRSRRLAEAGEGERSGRTLLYRNLTSVGPLCERRRRERQRSAAGFVPWGSLHRVRSG